MDSCVVSANFPITEASVRPGPDAVLGWSVREFGAILTVG
jgi:hypothetical protein